MNGPKKELREPEKLDDIIDEYVTLSVVPGYDALVEWIKRYPQYESELINFTVAWGLTESVPVSQQDVAGVGEDLDVINSGHMRIVQAILERHAPPATSLEAQAIEGLIVEGKAMGLSSRQLAHASGLSVPLITKLDKRMIQYASVPSEVIASLALALGREANAIDQYLRGGAPLALGAGYRADEEPTLPEQQDFADAVRADRTLTSNQRQRLLRLDRLQE